MTKDNFDKFQIISKGLSENKAAVILILGMIGSSGTALQQYFAGAENRFMNSAMTEQITVLSKYYANKECKK